MSAGTNTAGAKRARSASPATNGKKAPPAAPAKAKTIGHRTKGPLKRSAEVLAQLAEKRTRDELWADTVPFKRLTTGKHFDGASMLKLVTWNVAGLRGLLKKDEKAIEKLLTEEGIDVLCLQETKLNPEDASANSALGVVPGYAFTDHACSLKKGYSGVRTYLRISNDNASLFTVAGGVKHTTGMNLPDSKGPNVEDGEGRILTTICGGGALALVNTYVPNSGMTLDRLEYRTTSFDKEFRAYLKALDAHCVAHSSGAAAADGPVGAIWAGDLNVAERDYDRYYAGTFKTMQECSGFTPEERMSFRETLRACDVVDAFRALYPTAAPVDTFWSSRLRGREKGLGWRIDYFVVPRRMMPMVVDCFPMPSVMGSDHCPLQMWLRRQRR